MDQARFGKAGEDVIRGATEYQCEVIRGLLCVTLWESFCGQEWDSRRTAKEAA